MAAEDTKPTGGLRVVKVGVDSPVKSIRRFYTMKVPLEGTVVQYHETTVVRSILDVHDDYIVLAMVEYVQPGSFVQAEFYFITDGEAHDATERTHSSVCGGCFINPNGVACMLLVEETTITG